MGQKVNPQGFRVGINKLWRTEGQCYGKNFTNSKKLYKKTIFMSNYLNQYFESETLIKSELMLKIIDNKWQYNTECMSLVPRNNFYTQIPKKLKPKILTVGLRKYNTVFWHQNGLLICEFVKYSLKKGLAFHKVVNLIRILFCNKKNHTIVLKTVSGTQLFEFTGIKIKYTGRFGGSRNRMSSDITFQTGAVSLQKLETHIEFCEVPLYTKQGVCNLQVWMAYKVIQV